MYTLQSNWASYAAILLLFIILRLMQASAAPNVDYFLSLHNVTPACLQSRACQSIHPEAANK